MTLDWSDWIAPRRSQLSAPWRRRRPDRPWVFGHRGARHAAPENTLVAFDLALDEGADGVELDVRLDGDRRVIVLHDPTLRRVTDGADCRSVESMTAAELDAVDVGQGERIPRLVDVLDWASRRDTRLNVEVKSDVRFSSYLLARIARLVALRPDSRERILLSSFHPGFVATLARLLPGVAVAWLVHDGQRVLRYAPGRRLLGAAAIHPQASMVTEQLIAPWRAERLAINTWTVNDPKEAARLSQLGVDMLISDNPADVLHAVCD